MKKICPKCHHANDYGNFCEECGTRLLDGEASARTESAPASEGPVYPVYGGHAPGSAGQPSTGQAYLQNAKHVSKLYFSYFADVMKKPFAYAQNTGREQFVNGLITIMIFSLIIPLMIYLGFHDYAEFIGRGAFLTIVLKPFVGYVVFMMLLVTYTFLAVKFSKVNASYQDVAGRFGALLVPFTCSFLLSFVLTLLDAKIFVYFLLIGFIGSLFTVPALVISSYTKENRTGLDTVYGTILTYVLTFLTLYIMGKLLLSSIDYLMNSSLSPFF
ncbi:hypothetical protein J23TS9_49140 [Paenibacillus sp. J23TS9]|uniref:zinc ribbon domain-containing protein n=1 Tax=Paenibacillus sp. J23TS9 TaxID=2807193 RepID=UPI001B1B8E11|nr:zinc ribbon domain-containing protein [Paenibacillus sp. J23TS9]GIP29784.1 hypothetical protein J23TS9_49140 [Paenibacillus sp. J23TS9]